MSHSHNYKRQASGARPWPRHARHPPAQTRAPSGAPPPPTAVCRVLSTPPPPLPAVTLFMPRHAAAPCRGVWWIGRCNMPSSAAGGSGWSPDAWPATPVTCNRQARYATRRPGRRAGFSKRARRPSVQSRHRHGVVITAAAGRAGQETAGFSRQSTGASAACGNWSPFRGERKLVAVPRRAETGRLAACMRYSPD